MLVRGLLVGCCRRRCVRCRGRGVGAWLGVCFDDGFLLLVRGYGVGCWCHLFIGWDC